MATILVRRMRLASVRQEAIRRTLPVPRYGVAIGGQPAAVAQVADQVPVQRAIVRAAGLGIRAAERQVDGAGDLLVEQDRAGGAVDPGVGADAELAEEARAGVGVQRGVRGSPRRARPLASTTSPSSNVSCTPVDLRRRAGSRGP